MIAAAAQRRRSATMAAAVNLHSMNVEPRVREARSDETGLLHDFLVRAFSEYEGRLDPPSGVHPETVASLGDKLKEGGALICEADGVVAGCLFYAPKAAAGGARFQGSGRVVEKRTARLGELAERGDEVVEKVIQQASESGAPAFTEEFPDCVKVLGEILGEDRGVLRLRRRSGAAGWVRDATTSPRSGQSA